jgi:phosphoglycolate phosphatase
MSKVKLVIFDLDQTLVELIEVHDEASARVFREFFHKEARLTEIDYAGRSLLESFAELARRKNIPEEELREKSQEMLQRYEQEFIDNFPDDPSPYVLPGAESLLKGLSERGHFLVLYTGDSARIADKVLSATSLGKYFRFSVYGTEVKTRPDMVRLAIERAKKMTKKIFEGKDIVIVGDSIRDIECGQQFNALTIAIATGFYSKEVLASLKPDYLFDNLKDYDKVLQAIG